MSLSLLRRHSIAKTSAGGEDVAVVGSHVYAVIDGATDKAGLRYTSRGFEVNSGRFAAEVARDGGTASLGQVDYDTGRVEVVLAGACGSCSLTGATIEDGIKRILTQRLDWITEVVGSVVEEHGAIGRNGWRPHKQVEAGD